LKKLVTKTIYKEVKLQLRKNLLPILKKNKVPWRSRRYIMAKQFRKYMRRPQTKKMISQQVKRLQENHKLAIESKIRPIEEKAADHYEKCLRLAHALRTYNKWSQRALKKLQLMRPQTYPKQLEFRLNVGFTVSDFLMKKGMYSPSHNNYSRTPRKVNTIRKLNTH
jgi:hypothetical protein